MAVVVVSYFLFLMARESFRYLFGKHHRSRQVPFMARAICLHRNAAEMVVLPAGSLIPTQTLWSLGQQLCSLGSLKLWKFYIFLPQVYDLTQ